MEKASLIPQSDPEILRWARSFLAWFPTEGPRLGFSEPEVGAVRAELQGLIDVLERVARHRAALQALVAYKDQLLHGSGSTLAAPPALEPLPPPAALAPGVIERLQAVVQRVAELPGSASTGQQDLPGSGGASAGTSLLGQVAPKARTAALPGGEVRIEFVRGDSDGVVVESRRGSETEWRRIAIDRFSPYVDTRPSLRPDESERREYRLRYLDEDDPVGPYSAVLVVDTVP